MTNSDSGNVRTYRCPSPDSCPFTTGSAGELAEHVNTEHVGEYRRDDWPDTDAGRTPSTSTDESNDDQEDG